MKFHDFQRSPGTGHQHRQKPLLTFRRSDAVLDPGIGPRNPWGSDRALLTEDAFCKQFGAAGPGADRLWPFCIAMWSWGLILRPIRYEPLRPRNMVTATSIGLVQHDGEIRRAGTGRSLRYPSYPCNTLAYGDKPGHDEVSTIFNALWVMASPTREEGTLRQP
jgi:hypothetical protein